MYISHPIAKEVSANISWAQIKVEEEMLEEERIINIGFHEEQYC